MVQEEAMAKPKPSKYIETKYSDKVTFMASRSPQINLLSYPPLLLACSDGSIYNICNIIKIPIFSIMILLIFVINHSQASFNLKFLISDCKA